MRLRIASRFDERPLRETGGLGAAAWWRIAILCSFVEPLPHADACRLPMLVLPPPRLYLLNPVQALQAAISSQLLRPGWAARSRAIEQLLPGPALRRAYQAFFHRLLPRVLEAGDTGQRQARTPDDVQRLRWAIEDAWGDPAVLRRWIDFAQRLDAAGLRAPARADRCAQLGAVAAGAVQRRPGDSRAGTSSTAAMCRMAC